MDRGDPGGPECAGTCGPTGASFQPLAPGVPVILSGCSLSVAPHVQGTYMAPPGWRPLCHSMRQALKGQLPPGSFSILQLPAPGGEAPGMAPPAAWDSAVSLVAAGPPTGDPAAVPSLSAPGPSPRSQSGPRPGVKLRSDPHSPAPSRCTFQGSRVPAWGSQGLSAWLCPFSLSRWRVSRRALQRTRVPAQVCGAVGRSEDCRG